MSERKTSWLRARLEQLFANELMRRVAKNSSYLFGASGVSAGISMLQGILTARMLGVAGFGTLSTIILFTSTINNLASFRMNELVVKYVGQFTEEKDTQRARAVFRAALLVEMAASLVAFGLVALLAPLGAQYFAKDSSTTPLFLLYSLVILVNLIAESSAGFLQIFDRFGRLASLNLVQSLVTLALIALAFFGQAGLAGILTAYLIGKTIHAVGVSLSALRAAGRLWGPGWWRLPPGLLRSRRGELARFAISTNASATISLATKDSEMLWVSLLRGPVEAGYYRLAIALANMAQLPVEPLPKATYPELSRQVANGRWENVRLILRQGSLMAGGYSLLVFIFLAIAGQFLIRLLYTSQYLPAYPALIILLVGLLVANTFYWRRIMLLALGRAGFPARLNLVLAILKIAGILLLVPTYGYLASAALLSAFYIASSLISSWKIHLCLAQSDEAAA